MKQIVITYDNGHESKFYDNEVDITDEEFLKRVQNIFSPSNNVIMLSTQSNVLIVRPSRIVSIEIKETTNKREELEQKNNTSIKEDIVTDM